MRNRFLLLAAELLDMASEEFSNHGCNDFKTPSDLSTDDLQALADLHNLANFGSEERAHEMAELHPDQVETVIDLREYMNDATLMSALACGLRKMAEGES